MNENSPQRSLSLGLLSERPPRNFGLWKSGYGGLVCWEIRLRQGLRRDKGGDILDERIRMEKKNR